MQDHSNSKSRSAQEVVESPFSVELGMRPEVSFCKVLLESVDEAFSSLGESAKTLIYYHLEKEIGIRRFEIPFRIDDFQDALERIFGISTRQLEILMIKHLHEKSRISLRWNMPRWVVPELTFKEYVRHVKIEFEKRQRKNEDIE